MRHLISHVQLTGCNSRLKFTNAYEINVNWSVGYAELISESQIETNLATRKSQSGL
jgi:hypothetical protein